jgi:hypothetical protein
MSSRKKTSATLFTALLLMVLSTPALADDHFFLWKVYAGKFRTSVRQGSYPFGSGPEIREFERNTRDGIVVADNSEIECSKRVIFGVIYHVMFERMGPANFEVTLHYPHLSEEKDGETSHMHRNTVVKPPRMRYATEWHSWTLDKDEMKDGDFVLILHRDETVFMRHIFKLRGCDSSEDDAN